MSRETLRYTCDDALARLVGSLVATESEGTYWDFKREWYASNYDLVHDVICLANNPASETALLVVGIDESDAYRVYDVDEHAENRKNTQQVNNVLRSAHWAESYPGVRVVSTRLGTGTIDVLVIEPDRDAVPYYLLRDYGKGKQIIRAGAIYVRQQDGNTPKSETATALVTERLWKRHFGIDKTPLERLPRLLSQPDDWESTYSTFDNDSDNDAFSSCYYHKAFPEFTFVRRAQDDKDLVEFFMLASCFFDGPSWYSVTFYYHQTMLTRLYGSYSDHLFIPEPKSAFVGPPGAELWHDDITRYGYYIKCSLVYWLERFELGDGKESSSSLEEHDSAMEIIPIFENEGERKTFERWISLHWDEFQERCAQQRKPFMDPERYVARYAEGGGEIIREQAKDAAILVDMLDEFRMQRPAL